MRMFQKVAVSCDISSWSMYLPLSRSFSQSQMESKPEEYGRRQSRSFKNSSAVSSSWREGLTRSIDSKKLNGM